MAQEYGMEAYYTRAGLTYALPKYTKTFIIGRTVYPSSILIEKQVHDNSTGTLYSSLCPCVAPLECGVNMTFHLWCDKSCLVSVNGSLRSNRRHGIVTILYSAGLTLEREGAGNYLVDHHTETERDTSELI